MKNLVRIFLIVALTSFLATEAFATAQIPDILIYKGEEYALFSNPLEEYFEKHPDEKPQSDVTNTALWRGYIATFEIKDNQLFIKDIEIQYYDEISDEYLWRSVIEEVFPNQKEVKVDWFTGLLVIPQGKLVNYVHMGYASTYENYILFEIDKGNLTKEKKFNHKEYEKFKKSNSEPLSRQMNTKN